MNKQETGIFSGSFNPIYIGHLALVNYLCEYEGLDEVWFMVSPQNLLKAQEELWNDELRPEPVKLSTSDYPCFQTLNFKSHLPHPSYSAYMSEKLRETFSDRESYFIIGFDNWERFGYWYQSERIIKEDQILIYSRPGLPVKEKGLPETVCLVHFLVFEIGSTFIRETLDARKDVWYFMHPRVWEAIQFTPLIDEE